METLELVVVPSGTLPKLTLLGVACSDPALAFAFVPVICPPKQPLSAKDAQPENKIKMVERKHEWPRSRPAVQARERDPRQFRCDAPSLAARAFAIAPSNVTQEKMSRNCITEEDLYDEDFLSAAPYPLATYRSLLLACKFIWLPRLRMISAVGHSILVPPQVYLCD